MNAVSYLCRRCPWMTSRDRRLPQSAVLASDASRLCNSCVIAPRKYTNYRNSRDSSESACNSLGLDFHSTRTVRDSSGNLKARPEKSLCHT